eukprot:1447871-Prorocentrum_lima.AAC.1
MSCSRAAPNVRLSPGLPDRRRSSASLRACASEEAHAAAEAAAIGDGASTEAFAEELRMRPEAATLH